ncbi:MAG: DUF721 domain-containing protein [Myxococcota bacterium]
MSTRRHNPAPRPTALGDVLDGTRRVTLQRARAAVDRDTWRRAVGRRIAERTDVGQIKQGELTVYVASAAWAQELSLLTREIAERLAAHGIRVEKVRFRVKAQGLPAAAPRAESKPKPAPPKPLPAELRAHLERVADDELRGAIAGAAELALSRLSNPKRPAATQKPTAAPQKSPAATPERRALRGEPAPTSAPPNARSPRVAATRSAPSDRMSVASHASQRRKREER